MIKALRKRARPDNLVNQVRAGGKSMARRLYLIGLSSVGVFLVFAIIGPMVFLDADGLVTKERSIMSTDFNARVIEVHVKPGDEVKVGTLLATVSSSETLDRIADLATKLSTAGNRESTLKARVAQVHAMLPLTRERNSRARATVKQMESLVARQLTTTNRLAEATRELYTAEREEAQLAGEIETSKLDLVSAASIRKEFSEALELVKSAFNGGRIVSTFAGTIGPKVPSSGSILRTGDTAFEIYRGEVYVIGYLPTSRLFNVEVGDTVFVTDGKLRSQAKIVRVEAIAETLPPEFQSVFSARERQQVVRVEMDGRGAEEFPIHGKVKVTGFVSPTNAISLMKTSLAFVTNSVTWALRMVTKGIGSIVA